MNPILFIHGIIGTDDDFQPTIKYLRKKGIEKFYQFSYRNRYGLTPIKAAAEELAEYIKTKVKEKNIDVVAISQGGIVALTYLKFYSNPNVNVEKLFTICSPHKGSRLARILNLPGFVDLRPNSDLLKELEIFEKQDKTKLYSIYTPFDCVVFPGWNARSRYGQNKIIFCPGHGASLYSLSAMKFIYKNL